MSLQRRKPLLRHPKGKGNGGEVEVVKMLHARGWLNARRNFMSGGAGGGDIIGGPEGVHLEVKRRERCSIWEWLAQAERDAQPTDIPCVVFRRNRSEWWCAVPADELFALLQLRES